MSWYSQLIVLNAVDRIASQPLFIDRTAVPIISIKAMAAIKLSRTRSIKITKSFGFVKPSPWAKDAPEEIEQPPQQDEQRDEQNDISKVQCERDVATAQENSILGKLFNCGCVSDTSQDDDAAELIEEQQEPEFAQVEIEHGSDTNTVARLFETAQSKRATRREARRVAQEEAKKAAAARKQAQSEAAQARKAARKLSVRKVAQSEQVKKAAATRKKAQETAKRAAAACKRAKMEAAIAARNKKVVLLYDEPPLKASQTQDNKFIGDLLEQLEAEKHNLEEIERTRAMAEEKLLSTKKMIQSASNKTELDHMVRNHNGNDDLRELLSLKDTLSDLSVYNDQTVVSAMTKGCLVYSL